MSGNAQKTPIVKSLNSFAASKAQAAIKQTGRELPCSVVAVNGQLVTVKFEVNSKFTLPQVTIPIATSQYDWLPVQVGDKGYAASADVYLGGMSGQGGGVADLSQRGNLTALVFVPISNKSWGVTGQANSNQRVVSGPQGAVLQDAAGHCQLVLTTSGVQVFIGGTLVFSIGASGSGVTGGGNFTVTGGDVIADTISLKTHHTSGVTPGGGTSGPPVP